MLGWNHDVQAAMLHIYQLAITEVGLMIGISLSINDDFTWTLSCRSHPVNPEHCSLLGDMPSLLNSGLCISFWYNLNETNCSDFWLLHETQWINDKV